MHARGGFVGLIRQGKNAPRAVQVAQARVRCPDKARRAGQQPDAQPLFKRGDGSRDRRGRHVQPAGGARKALLLRDSNENIHQMKPVHGIVPLFKIINCNF